MSSVPRVDDIVVVDMRLAACIFRRLLYHNRFRTLE